MDSTVIAAGITGLFAGVMGSLVAPWIHWGIEKRRDRRATQRDLLIATREYVASKDFGASQFAKRPEYVRLRLYLAADVIRAIENSEEVQDQMDNPGEFRESLRKEVLEELSRIERKWNLI